MDAIHPGTQRALVWCGPVFVVLFLIGFGGLVGWIPPRAPSETPEQIAAIFRADTDRIRFGLVLTSLCSALLLPYFAVLSTQMKRMEGRHSPLAYLQMTAGALAVIEFIFPVMIWQTAAFRPERSAELLGMLHDLGWLPFLGIVSTAVVQGIAIGVAVLQDRAAEPVFPRWAGYFNIWVILMLLPGGVIVFFKSGPLAWNGLFAWWLVLIAYFLWIVVNTVLLLRAINRQVAAAPTLDEPDLPALRAEIAQLRQEVGRLATLSA